MNEALYIAWNKVMGITLYVYEHKKIELCHSGMDFLFKVFGAISHRKCKKF